MMMPPSDAKMAKVSIRSPATNSETHDSAAITVSSQWGVPKRRFTAASRRGSRPSPAISSSDLVPQR